MATSTLAQDALYLKQLDQTLKEIHLLHQDIHNTLHIAHNALQTLERNMFSAYSTLNVSWSKVTELFIPLEYLKTNQSGFNDNEDRNSKID